MDTTHTPSNFDNRMRRLGIAWPPVALAVLGAGLLYGAIRDLANHLNGVPVSLWAPWSAPIVLDSLSQGANRWFALLPPSIMLFVSFGLFTKRNWARVILMLLFGLQLLAVLVLLLLNLSTLLHPTQGSASLFDFLKSIILSGAFLWLYGCEATAREFGAAPALPPNKAATP